jgi:TonB family protein
MSASSFRSHSASLPIAIAIVLASIVAHTVGAAPASAQSVSADLPALLARPISPGSIGLLANHAGQPAAQKRLAEAVKHENPSVRAVAARVAFITNAKALAPALIGAVAKEEHAHTAAEQVRALMGLLGAPGDQIVLRAVTRIGGPTVTAMADVLARTRPADIAGRLPTLMPLANPRELGGALATACAQHPSSANEILQAALASKSPYLFEAAISSLREAARPVPAAVLMQGLQSADVRHRSAVIWHLFFATTAGDAIPDEVAAAAAGKPIAAGTTARDLTWDDYGRELLARFRGSRPTEADWAGLISLPENGTSAYGLPLEAYARMTNAELKAIGAVRGDNKAGLLRRSGRDAKRTDREVEARTLVMRTIPIFAKGLIADMLALSDCRPPSDTHFAAGNVTYRPDGRPERIGLIQSPMSNDCQAFVRGMMVLTIASTDHPVAPDSADYVLLPFERKFLECADDPFAPARPRELDMTYEPPRDARVPAPTYPEAARRANTSGGVVRVRASVSHTGCVTGAETIRSVHPLFDFAAIQAMIQGRYTPAKINGTPVDSFVNWSMQFYAP